MWGLFCLFPAPYFHSLHDSHFKLAFISYWAATQAPDKQAVMAFTLNQLSSDWLPLSNRKGWGFCAHRDWDDHVSMAQEATVQDWGSLCVAWDQFGMGNPNRSSCCQDHTRNQECTNTATMIRWRFVRLSWFCMKKVQFSLWISRERVQWSWDLCNVFG